MKRILYAGLALALVTMMLLAVACGEDATKSDIPAGPDKADDAVAAEDGIDAIDSLPEATPGSYTDLTPEQARQLMDDLPDLVVIDVSPNYAEGHLPGAINYYVGDGSLDAAIPTLDKTVPYLVYCHVDSAAIAGAQALVDAGFPTVYRLEGNYSAWVEAGYRIEK